MKAPDAVQLVSKHGRKDCVLAALASYLTAPYEAVVAAAGHVCPNFVRVGVENKDAVRIARRLKQRVRWTPSYDIDEDTGVLGINYHVGNNEHAVLLLEGRIVELEDNPITSWEPSAYLQAHGARAGYLLIRSDANV